MRLKVSDLKPHPIQSTVSQGILLSLGCNLTSDDLGKVSETVLCDVVIDQPSAFNAVLGRSSLRELRAITSIYHLLMKFPTLHEVVKLKDTSKMRGSATTRP